MRGDGYLEEVSQNKGERGENSKEGVRGKVGWEREVRVG